MARKSKDTKQGGADAPDCLCGCGGVVESNKARFLRGHDAKLKGTLIRIARGDLPTSNIPNVALPLLTEGEGVAGITVKKLGGGKLQVVGVKPLARKEKVEKLPPGPKLPAKSAKKGKKAKATAPAVEVEDDEEEGDEE